MASGRAGKLIHIGSRFAFNAGVPQSPHSIDQLRLDALREYGIMDTTPEEGFDDICRLTSFICGTPLATVTLLDLQRQWFKAKIGLEALETPISESICATAIKQKELFLVRDTHEDARFVNFACVTGSPGIRFYAGAPLITPQRSCGGHFMCNGSKPSRPDG